MVMTVMMVVAGSDHLTLYPPLSVCAWHVSPEASFIELAKRALGSEARKTVLQRVGKVALTVLQRVGKVALTVLQR